VISIAVPAIAPHLISSNTPFLHLYLTPDAHRPTHRTPVRRTDTRNSNQRLTHQDIFYLTIFLLGGAYALKVDAHVRIDFISLKFPKRFQQLFNGILYLAVLAPVFGIFSYVSSKKAIEAFIVGEGESVSPWAPLVWPFYSIIAIGLIAVTLQFISESLKLLSGQTMPGQNHDDVPEKDMST